MEKSLFVFNTDTVLTWKKVKIALSSEDYIYEDIYIVFYEV